MPPNWRSIPNAPWCDILQRGSALPSAALRVVIASTCRRAMSRTSTTLKPKRGRA